RHRAGAVEQVFKLSTFENDGGESHFVEKLFIIEGLNDHTNAAGDRRLVSHEIFAAARDIVATRRGQRIHVYHHWFPRQRFVSGSSRTTPVPTRPRTAMARKTLMITLAQSARNRKSVRQPSLRFAMIRRETGGKVRCEQALFVFGIKTEQSSSHRDGHPQRSRGS